MKLNTSKLINQTGGRAMTEAEKLALRLERQRLAVRKYRDSEKGKATMRRAFHKARKADPRKHAARVLVNTAVARGKLVKPDICQLNEGCSGRLEAHHYDYSRPLEVVWVCRKHHGDIHNG